MVSSQGDSRPAMVMVLTAGDDPGLRLLEGAAAPGVRFVRGGSLEDLREAAKTAEALYYSGGGRALLESVVASAGALRWVHLRMAGIDEIVFRGLVRDGLVVTNARGVYSASLAEFALGGILHFAKDFRRMLRSQARGAWDPYDVVGLRGQTLGIVGYGDIGSHVAEAARGFGLRVLALRRRRPEAGEDTPVAEFLVPDGLPTLMERSDHVVAALPLTAETRGLIDAAAIRAMKPSAVFVNVGRGRTVDEPALVRALEEKRIRGAALDVFEQEPLPPGHPFYRLENVLLSPHCADHTLTWHEDSARLFLENLARFRRGDPLRNVVDLSRGY
jgi:phosphoglycerate dehydrogenase-like enzyme